MRTARYQTIVHLALPIMGGMLSQNVMNLVDTAMVGSLGNAALAAVGMSSFAAFMSQAFIMGLSSGVQAMAARRLGEANEHTMAMPLDGGLILALLIGVPLAFALFLAAPTLYPWLNSDPAVIAEGVPYLRARLVAIPAVGMNFAFRGYFNGVNRSRIYLRSLVLMHVCNLVLNYGLIYGKLGMPELGATGAGIGTAVATYVGTLTYFAMGLRHARRAGFLRGIPDRETFATLLRLSIPDGIRQLFFAAGLTVLFWIVGRIGTTALAAANVLINLMLVAILPGLGLGMAAASLVAQALGRGDRADAAQWGWDVARLALVVLAVLGLPMIALPDALLGIFIRESATIDTGRLPLVLVGATMAFDGVALVLQGAMLGAGDSRRVMVVAVALQWALLLPASYLVGPALGLGLLGVWAVQAAARLVQAACFAAMWHRGSWAEAKV